MLPPDQSNHTPAQITTEEQDDDNDCNVLDDEEEAMDALKTVQANQAQKLKDNNQRVFLKISHVERKLLELVSLVEEVQQDSNELAAKQISSQEELEKDLVEAKDEAA